MEARSIDTDFAFPELATRALNRDEIASHVLDFPPAGEEPLGVFRGLMAAVMIQIGVVLLVVLGWQAWRFLR